MTRLVLYLVGVVALATGLSWLADRPGSLVINWQGYDIETSVFRAVVLFAFLVGLAVVVWSIVRQIWSSPAAVGRFFNRRRQERGLDALSSGMIAIGAGDKALASKAALQARKALPNEPLTHLLRAQAAQLGGDPATARRIYEAMLGTPDTEQLGLRGLFIEAQREGEAEAARQFAERSLALNPKLGWAADALFELQCKAGDWAGALETLGLARKHGHIDKTVADRRRAVLLTGQAQVIEDDNGAKALELAQEAHNLAPDLIPAAAIAGRQLAARGSTPKAAKVIERTWRSAPHPDLAVVYAYARPGDSPRDRLDRIKRLARGAPHSAEGPIALATAAIDAREWDEARAALVPLLDNRLTQRVCTLMARIEGGQHENAGRVREWLARAVNAPRDPAWTADGIVAEIWSPASPVTGALDAFNWKVPVEAFGDDEKLRALEKMDDLVMLGAGPMVERAIEVKPVAVEAPLAASAPPRPEPRTGRPSGVAATTAESLKAPLPQTPLQSNASISITLSPTGEPEIKSVAATGLNGEKPSSGTIGTGSARAGAAAGSKTSEPGVQSIADARKGAVDARVFTPTRAPDDPGLDEADAGPATKSFASKSTK